MYILEDAADKIIVNKVKKIDGLVCFDECLHIFYLDKEGKTNPEPYNTSELAYYYETHSNRKVFIYEFTGESAGTVKITKITKKQKEVYKLLYGELDGQEKS